MKDTTYKFIVTVLVLVILFGGGMLLYRNLDKVTDWDGTVTETAGTQHVEPAQDFSVADVDGKEVKLSDFVGQAVVVNFWASWCGPCKSELPHFQSAWETYGEEVQFMMVNLATSDSVSDAQTVLTDGGYTFPVYYDTTGECAAAYSISAIPMTLFVAADGSLVSSTVGMLTAQTLEEGIQSILPD